MTDHPITPPPELVEKWIEQGVNRPPITDYMMWFATQAARWGADQELEVCCEWLEDEGYSLTVSKLRAARRPKPPSLAEQALEAQRRVWTNGRTQVDWELIRRALERLQELENND